MADNVNAPDNQGENGASNQNGEKQYSESEVKQMIASSIERAIKDRFKNKPALSEEEVEEYKNLKTEKQRAAEELMKKQGEFDKLLSAKEQSWQKKVSDQENLLKTKDSLISSLVVDSSILEEATRQKAIEPSDVVALLRKAVNLKYVDSKPIAEVIDSDGTPRFKKGGEAYTISDLITEFREKKPHLFSAPDNATKGSSNLNANIAVGQGQNNHNTGVQYFNPSDYFSKMMNEDQVKKQMGI